MNKFIHDHINQLALAAVGATQLITENMHDTALASLISAAVAFALKNIFKTTPPQECAGKN